MRYYPQVPARRTRAILADVVVVLLIVLFAWLGLKVHSTVDQLAALGRGVQDAGRSVQSGFQDAGSVVGSVPLVGGQLKSALNNAGAQTGGNATALGREGEVAVNDAARLLGWVTFGLPTLLVLLWAIPRRVIRVRRMNAAIKLLGAAETPERRRLLAMRAAFDLSFGTLLSYTEDPIGDLAEGRYEPLIRAVFEDVGLRPPAAEQGLY